MITFLSYLFVLMIGFWFGKHYGIAQTMIRLQGIFEDLKKIQNTFKQWNEDNL